MYVAETRSSIFLLNFVFFNDTRKSWNMFLIRLTRKRRIMQKVISFVNQNCLLHNLDFSFGEWQPRLCDLSDTYGGEGD